MIVKRIQNLGNRMEKIQETCNKDLEELQSKLQCWTSQAKQPVRQEYRTIHQKKNEMTKNLLQTKEQGKNLQDQINEDEIGKLP